ncbi:MAG: hypothetical protein IT200_04695 [Thermoleophilia bacterium]|nr:hypothetical protein [Thermoleophilia bacterium]
MRTPAGGRGFAMRAPLPVGVYPDAATALRAALVAAPGWLRFLLSLPALLNRPVRRWGAYRPRPGDRLGPLRVLETGPHRLAVAGGAGGLAATVEILVSDGAVTARGEVRGDGAAAVLLRRAARMLVRALLARSAGYLAARVQPSPSTFANTAVPAVANTMV